jgi:hypothetical protein
MSEMNDEERYLFDVQGLLVLKGVLTPESVRALNALIDEQRLPEPGEDVQSQRFGGFLRWGQPFRDLLDHPRVLPVLQELLDPALRLDHCYGIYMRQGTSGLRLHGGGTPYDLPEYFHFRNGKMYNGLTVVTWALSEVPPGQGGFACIPGSHKANYACPPPIRSYERNPGCVIQVPMEAGDVLIFTEALTHGTHPWTAAHQRRSLLYKYCPGYMAWGAGYKSWPAELHELLTPEQRLLLEPPYENRRRALGAPESPGKAAY